MIVFAESSSSNPYAAQKAAVSASAGSHAKSSYSPRPARAASRASRAVSGLVGSSLVIAGTVPACGRGALARPRTRWEGSAAEPRIRAGQHLGQPRDVVRLVDAVRAVAPG